MLPVLVAILTGLTVICLGGAVLVNRSARQRQIAERIGGGLLAGTAVDGPQRLVGALDRIGTAASSGKTSRKLKQDLANAGFHGPGAAATFLGLKILLLLIGLGLGASVATMLQAPTRLFLLVAAFPGVLLFFAPNMIVDMRRARRRQDIREHLPDAIDLLEISIAAGMGLDAAWNAVADEVRNVSEVLADEMALTNLEISLSTPRADAMRHMADRTGADELSSMVAVMVQSERFGTSMAEAMRTFAQTMREGRSLRAQEAAEKLAVKLIFPMLVFLFPAVVMVVAGPAVLAMKKMLQQ